MTAGFSVWHIMGSMRAVDKWSQSAQSNMSNSTKNGYKGYDVIFGGGSGTTLLSNPTMQALGNQVAEQIITMAYTSIDWTQGNLISTRNDLDFAINGNGFFMLTALDPSVAANNTQKVFYSRDGSFHDDGTGKLRNSIGLYYVSRANAITAGYIPAGTSTTLTIGAVAGSTTVTVTSAAAANIVIGSTVYINNQKLSVSSVLPLNTITFSPPLNYAAAIGDIALTGSNHAIAFPSNLKDLQYSRYGSTIFEDGVGNNLSRIVDEPEQQGLGQLKQGQLESSNVKLQNQLLSLNDSKGVYEGLTKSLKVFWDNFDIGLNLLK